MPPNIPYHGEGPIRYGDPGPASPYDNDENIRYAEMVRHQAISQYQQRTSRPSSMTLAQHRQITSDPRFQYGVSGGQDKRFYQRQADLQRLSFFTSLGKGAADLVAYGGAEATIGAGLATAGIGGAAAFALPAAAAMAPMAFINAGVQRSMDRRRFMASVSSDIEQNRGRLGFSGLSYEGATHAGARIAGQMSSPGQFFSKSEQSRIHKIGISNDLLSARGRGIDSGSIKQYEKNFAELKETTEDVVKLLQTTIEGGMSVIKELQQKGFGSMRQIRQQVVQAKAFGKMTGLGTQNMMSVGAAGAQAVQGTPWDASVGSNMYQTGAAQAGMLANSGAQGAYAVRKVGGTAAAGGVLARATMNMMSSGIGTKLAAFAMDPRSGEIDDSKMTRLMSGNASALEIIRGANQTGYAMGSNGRVQFERYKQNMLNKVGEDPMAMNKMMSAGFAAWEKQRPHNNMEAKAWVWSRKFTGDINEQNLLFQQTMSNPGLAQMRAGVTAQQMGANVAETTGYRGILDRMGSAISKSWYGTMDDVGDAATRMADKFGGGATSVWAGIERGWARGRERAWAAVGRGDDFGYENRMEAGNVQGAADFMMGVTRTGNVARGRRALRGASREEYQAVMGGGGMSASQMKSKFGFDSKRFFGGKVNDINYALQRAATSIAEGKGNQALIDDYDFRRAVGIKLGSDEWDAAVADKNFMGSLVSLSGANNRNVHKQFDKATGALDAYFKANKNNPDALARARMQMDVGRKAMYSNADNTLRTDPAIDANRFEKKKGVYTWGEKGAVSEVVNALKTESLLNKTKETQDWGGIASFAAAKTQMEEADKAMVDAFAPKFATAAPKTNNTYASLWAGGVQTILPGVDRRGLSKLNYDLDTAEGARGLSQKIIDIEDQMKAGVKLSKDDKTIQGLTRGFADDPEKVANLRKQVRDRDIGTGAVALNQDLNAYMDSTTGMNAEEKAGFREKVGLAISGQMKPGEAKVFAKESADKLAAMTGAAPNMIKYMASKGGDALGGFLTMDRGVRDFKMGGASKIKQITSDLSQLRDAIQAGGEEAVKVVMDGSATAPKEIKGKENMLTAVAKLEDQRAMMEIEARSKSSRESSQGRSLGASARPAIMNYWNNRWVTL